MRVRFLELAHRELSDAVLFYDLEFSGLGDEFKNEVKAAVARISRHPAAWPTELGEIRKCLLHRFPYKILYSVESDYILVVAVAHQHRMPEYWAERVDHGS